MRQRLIAGAVSVVLLDAVAAAPPVRSEPLSAYTVAGDAIPEPLGGLAGDVARGRAAVLDRAQGNCLICHRAPVPGEPFQGEIGPDLAGVGRRLSSGQIRLRLVDQSRLDPATLMPPYYRIDNLKRVAAQFERKPVLEAQQIEDIVAWLATLKDAGKDAGP